MPRWNRRVELGGRPLREQLSRSEFLLFRLGELCRPACELWESVGGGAEPIFAASWAKVSMRSACSMDRAALSHSSKATRMLALP
ncbi:MAG TPA: hypothetical protein VNG13_10325 [Mycobacteriales bacterium]|nr:hypothetical protein [Mycobacteriales bacterium]